jgi:hypothetical protein
MHPHPVSNHAHPTFSGGEIISTGRNTGNFLKHKSYNLVRSHNGRQSPITIPSQVSLYLCIFVPLYFYVCFTSHCDSSTSSHDGPSPNPAQHYHPPFRFPFTPSPHPNIAPPLSSPKTNLDIFISIFISTIRARENPLLPRPMQPFTAYHPSIRRLSLQDRRTLATPTPKSHRHSTSTS